jgi:hypothetical protein
VKGIPPVKHLKSTLPMFVTLILVLLCGAASAYAQDAVSGKYEGTGKSAGAADVPLTLELKNDAGKVTGTLSKGQTSIAISEGTVVDGKLSLKFGDGGKEGVLIAKLEGDKITGDWTAGAQKSTVELKKVAVSGGAVSLAGQWDAVADANGQAFPFVLTLKVDGESVTGSSSSQLGEAPIKTGTWKDGHLSIQVEGGSGTVTMSATIVDGKLSGDFDFAGQLSGKWTAVKKN